jgi:pimeloyl-ACP methyl ester carboxylesterase
MRMRVLAGFVIGVLGTVMVLALVRHIEVASITGEIAYRFDTCVFGTSQFPGGDLENGRLLRRSLVPMRVTTRFYDAQFHEVTEAAKPGRYGAVVDIDLGGGTEVWRFITLYRTPAPVGGDTVKIPLTAQLPAAALGLDPMVVSNQQREIGLAIQYMLIDWETNASPESVAILLAGLSETRATDAPALLHDNAATRNEAWWYELQTRLGLAPTYHYLVDLPRGYADDPGKRWPLILFLHHSAATGSDLSLVRNCALAGLIERGKQVPAIVVSPQCPDAQIWRTPILAHLITEMETRYRVDRDRVYLPGVSLGGDETWNFALIHPDWLAAIVPMSGESDAGDAARLRNLPVWAFQGGKDPVVAPSQIVAMVDAIRNAGGHAHLTIYPEAGHDCWDQAYSTDALWTWLFAQRRGEPEVTVPGTPSP